MRALVLTSVLLCSLSGVAIAAPASKKTPPPVYAMRELVLDAIVPEQGRVTRRIRIGIPKGWTGERDPNGRSIKLAGPEGEGMILVAGALHPSQLTPYLTDLKNAHPSAAPSPPQPLPHPHSTEPRRTSTIQPAHQRTRRVPMRVSRMFVGRTP